MSNAVWMPGVIDWGAWERQHADDEIVEKEIVSSWELELNRDHGDESDA